MPQSSPEPVLPSTSKPGCRPTVPAPSTELTGATALARLELEVAARQQAEANLAEREALIQNFFSNTAVGMAMVDLTGRLLLVNEAFAQLLAAEPLELAGMELDTLTHPDDLDLDKAARAELMEGSRHSYTVDKRFLGKCGAVVWGHLSVVLLRDSSDRPLINVVVCEDITARMRADEERARLERRLQETERLERMGILAGGVTHDFNNILTSIQFNADLAMLSLPNDSPAREYLEQIGQAVVRASELTGQMLVYSGRRRAGSGAGDLNRAISEITDLLRSGHMRHCIVRLSLTPGLPAVRAEGTQVRQIVMNLLVNAAEAIGPKGGEVVASTGIDELGRAALDGLMLGEEAAPGTFVRVSVSDTGCGMDSATLARIFDPFFTTKPVGTGIGLASVYGIVREHHGALWVQSKPGVGTLFHIWLPAAEA